MTAAAPEPGDEAPDGPSRGNGLTAARFVPLLDVEPRASEALLAALAAVGVAACVRPRPAAEGGGLDRLLVDEENVEAARLVAERELRQQAASGAGEDAPRVQPVDPPARSSTADASPEEVDAAWDAIVAGFHTETVDPVPRWPVAEDVAPRPAAPEDVDPAPRRRRSDRVTEERVSPAERPAERDDAEHYRPPPAPPVGRPSRHTGVALLVVAAGLALMIAPSLVGLGSSTAVFAVGVLMLTGGVGALVVRMHDGPRQDDGPDDGAVV